MEENGNLVDLYHHVGEEKLMAVLGLEAGAVGVALAWHLLRLAASLVQIDARSKRQVTPLNLADGPVEELVEVRTGQVEAVARAIGHEIVVEGDEVRLV